MCVVTDHAGAGGVTDHAGVGDVTDHAEVGLLSDSLVFSLPSRVGRLGLLISILITL